jgi:hypothetical protein
MDSAKRLEDHAENVKKFETLVNDSVDAQCQLFLKSFIFALGDDWKEVVDLSSRFKKYLDAQCETKDLNAAQAADFLQHNGRTRTAMQRRAELKDIDLDKNDRIGFVEYLLLHYKIMILTEYYKRKATEPQEDLSNGGIGVTGVGDKLLDELFTIPIGLSPALQAAIEEFTARKSERESKMNALQERSSKGGVRGMAAANELKQMEAADLTEMNRIEITLAAAKRRTAKNSAEVALDEKKKAEEKAQKDKAEASRAKLKARMAMFEKH